MKNISFLLLLFVTIATNAWANKPLENISIQLKWTHSFQFAGYYAAVEKGYYAKEGLKVTLKEIKHKKDPVQSVLDGDSQYGVSDSSLLVPYLNDKPVVLVAQILQHSPLVFISKKSSGIVSPYEMIGKKICFTQKGGSSAALTSMLASTLGSLDKIKRIGFTATSINDFLSGKTDAISAYTTTLYEYVKQSSTKYNIINPQNYGIDFYGDNLFTTQNEAQTHHARVHKVKRATLKGWKYALDHPQEIIDLIRKKYNTKLSKASLMREYKAQLHYIIPKVIPLGTIDPKRFARIAQDYYLLGLVQQKTIKANFIFDAKQKIENDALFKSFTAKEKAWLKGDKTLRVAGINFPPLISYNDEKAKAEGLAVDYLNLVGKKLDIHFTYTFVDFNVSKLQTAFKKDEMDIFPILRSSKFTQGLANVTKPFLSMSNIIVNKIDEPFINHISDLEGKTVAIRKNADYLRLKKKYPNIKFLLVSESKDVLYALTSGQADAGIGDIASIMHSIKVDEIKNIKIGGMLDTRTKWSMGLNIHLPSEALSVFNKAIATISNRQKDAIYDRWINTRFVKKQDYSLLYKIGAGLGIIIIIMFVVNRIMSKEITFRKKIENSLKHERDNFKKLFEATTDGHLIMQEGKFIDCNSATLRMLGLTTKKELLQTKPERWSPKVQADGEDSKTKADRYVQEILDKGEKRFEWIHQNKEGEPFWVDILATRIVYENKTSLYIVWRDKSEQKALEESLASSRDEAEAANKSKTEFLANMSHEIRTPMNAVIGFTELLEDSELTNVQKNYLNAIKAGSKNLLNIINDILDLSKIEAGKLSIEKLPFDIKTLIKELEQVFSLKIKEKGLGLDIHVAQDIPNTIFSDEIRIRQILFNLLGNAIKFTHEGKIGIVLEVEYNPTVTNEVALMIAINDTGIGINKANQQRVFNIFEQQEGQSTRQFGGTGLGLSISKKLATKMGGALTLDSQEGVGSTFSLVLPHVQYATDVIEQNNDLGFTCSFKPATILVVDDMKDNRELIKGLYKDQAFTFIEASQGEEALAMLESNSVDLILMDIRMPVMDGITATKRIKQNPKTQNIPVIAVTASVLQSEHDRIIKSGFDVMVEKPVNKYYLNEVLSRYLDCTVQEPLDLVENTAVDIDVNSEKVQLFIELFNEQIHQQQSKNNLTEIKKMAVEMEKFIEEHQCKELSTVVDALFEAVQLFDIDSIGSSLHALANLGGKDDER